MTTTTVTHENVDEYGNFSVVTRQRDDDGMVLSPVERKQLSPGAWDATGNWVPTRLNDQNVTIQAFATQYWTEGVVAAYKAAFPFIAAPPVDLKALAADKRFRVETAGAVFNGGTIDTSRESQAMITSAVVYLTNNPDAGSVKFKAVSGWITLNRATMLAIGIAIGARVQALFAVEEAVDADIDANTVTTAEQVENDTRWTLE